MKLRWILIAAFLTTFLNAQTVKTPINNGILQSDPDAAGYKILSSNMADYAGALSWNVSTNKFDATGGGGGGVARKFDVKTYGALGDGTTNDTSAIQAALAAIPSTGGVLYFPAGQYKYAGSTLTLNKQVTVEGDGGGNKFVTGLTTGSNGFPAISTIDFNSSNGTLFNVTANGCAFKNLGLRNTSSTTPTDGAGILVSSAGDRTRFDSISVDGFYIDIDVQAGSAETFDNCWIVAPVLYGIKLRNIALPDGGDHAISNCSIYAAASRGATSAIRIESGGGVKITNSKIVSMTTPLFVNGIDLAVANNVSTNDLLVSNCSIEGFSGIGIKGTTGATSSFWRNIVITGNQIAPGTANNQYAINLSATTAGDFSGVAITGNWANIVSSSNPAMFLANCSNVSLTGNGQLGFNGLLGVGVITFATSATIPAGGTTSQVLAKNSNTNYDVGWATVKFSPVPVAALPASPSTGQIAAVSDGLGGLTWGATVVTGGSSKYLVWWNGSNWTIVGK